LLEEVSAGACPLLANGQKPPPSIASLKQVLLPTMLARQKEMDGSVIDGDDDDKQQQRRNIKPDLALARTYHKQQFQLLSSMIQYTENVVLLASSSSSSSSTTTSIESTKKEVEVSVDNVEGELTSSIPQQEETSSSSSSSSSFTSNTWTDHPDCIDTNSIDSFPCAIAVFNAWVKSKKFPVQKIEAVQV
jgi:hypothetical protein